MIINQLQAYCFYSQPLSGPKGLAWVPYDIIGAPSLLFQVLVHISGPCCYPGSFSLFCRSFNEYYWPVLLQVSFLFFLLSLVKRSLFILSFHVRVLGIGSARASTEASQLPCTQTTLIEPAYRYSYNLWDVHWSMQAMILASWLTSRTIRCSVQLGRQQLSQLHQKNTNSDFTNQILQSKLRFYCRKCQAFKRYMNTPGNWQSSSTVLLLLHY